MKAKSVVNSFYYAFQGLAYTFKTQRNFRIHCLALLALTVLAAILEINILQALLLYSAAFLVMICELMNTAIEKAIDMYTTQMHPLAKIAKNCAAAAVLLAAANAILTGALILLPLLIQLVR